MATTQKTCESCGKPFQAARSWARFCSGTCRTASHQQSMVDEAVEKERQRWLADPPRSLYEACVARYLKEQARKGGYAKAEKARQRYRDQPTVPAKPD